MTSLDPMAEQIHMLPFTSTCWLSRFTWDFLKGCYRGSRAAAGCSSTVGMGALTRAMTAHCWLQLPVSLIGPLHSCSHIEGEIQGRIKQHGSAPTDPQTHSSMISSQRDCTHSNKHRRRLLSESNYLPLSISMAAGGQQALC